MDTFIASTTIPDAATYMDAIQEFPPEIQREMLASMYASIATCKLFLSRGTAQPTGQQARSSA